MNLKLFQSRFFALYAVKHVYTHAVDLNVHICCFGWFTATSLKLTMIGLCLFHMLATLADNFIVPDELKTLFSSCPFPVVCFSSLSF